MKYAIGVDIGATKTKAVLANEQGKILANKEMRTRPERSRLQISDDIRRTIDSLTEMAKKKKIKLTGIGIGIPGALKNGKLVFGGGTLERFTGLDLKDFFQKKLGSKVFMENDSQCFALAESFFGEGRKYSRVAGIIWATGIGAGFVDKNNLCNSGNPYEIGHIVVEPNIKSGQKCGCGQRGCAVNLASGKNIIKRYYQGGGKIKNVNVEKIFYSKEKIAKKVLNNAYKYLGLAISVFINIFNPDIVIIGGGASNLPKPAHAKLRENIYKYSLKALTKNLKIVKSKIGNFSGALGAASLVFRK